MERIRYLMFTVVLAAASVDVVRSLAPPLKLERKGHFDGLFSPPTVSVVTTGGEPKMTLRGGRLSG